MGCLGSKSFYFFWTTDIFAIYCNKHICTILLQYVAIISSTSITSPEMANSEETSQHHAGPGGSHFH